MFVGLMQMVFWGPHARNLDGRIKVEASQLEARCGQTKALRNMIYNWVVAKSRLNDSITGHHELTGQKDTNSEIPRNCLT